MWTYNYNYSDELYHYGVKGMKWGVRRYQNPDGTLTKAGKKQYYGMSKRELKKVLKKSGRTNRNAVEEEYRNEFRKHKQYNELGKRSNAIAARLMKSWDDDTANNGGKESNLSRELYRQLTAIDKEMTKIEIDVGKKYINKLNDAKLKDIKYSKSTEVGREMLKDYFKSYEMRKDGYIYSGLIGGVDNESEYTRPHNLA